MKRRGGNPVFLRTAALAGGAGVACIGTSVGMPVWNWMHGGHDSPVFIFFSLWGIIALMGAAANIYVYFQTTPPSRPPRGGHRVSEVTVLDARRKAPLEEQQRKAA